MIKMRLETIKKKRNAVEKYLKNDIIELLRTGLDYNAYGRVEGFLVERNRTACYSLIEQFIERISKHVSVMQKQSECPDECKEAIPSLIYAAARFSDLPELRDLRTLFTEKYGNSLEPFINQEFVKKLRAEPPTKEMKLQLMHDLAQENSIEWDSKGLEQKLFKPPPQQNAARHKSSNDANDNGGHKIYGNKINTLAKSDSHDEENGLSNIQERSRPKRNETDLASRGRKDTDDKYKQQSSTEEEETDQDLPKTSSTSVESVSSDTVEPAKPFYHRFIAPPYVRPSLDKEKGIKEAPTPTTAKDNNDKEKNNKLDGSVVESKPKPRSVRRRPSNPPPGHEVLSSNERNEAGNISSSAVKPKEARKGQTEESDQATDKEENMMDGLLMYYSKKKSPYEESASKWKANLAPPPGRQAARGTGGNGLRFRSTKSDLPSPPASTSTKEKKTTASDTKGKHARASSMEPDMIGGHVHPKLPEYDDLLATLNGR
ncbi:hypothetical protein CCACVL1_28047 [Corchorus capsularis]|uniref:Regulator of Vps4 activity in the MVB pathway protein n=1 Tax=Corchorus capsularis TaxID=210143 RepID=A0A1R3G7R7_COCAP|nr:hypothetical protein CCACVL1_28047 [Corchorus capsularis]